MDIGVCNVETANKRRVGKKVERIEIIDNFPSEKRVEVRHVVIAGRL